MKRTNVNTGYDWEQDVFKRLLHMTPTYGSGNRKELGSEDAYDNDRIGQAKATTKPVLTVKYSDIYQLRKHAQGKVPLMVLGFCSPVIATPESGRITLPEDIWAMVPIETMQFWFEAWVREQNAT